MNKEFKYYPEDFGKLTVKVLHMDITFDIYDDHTVVYSALTARALQPIKKLDLNAKNLEILSVNCKHSKNNYKYDKKKNILKVFFPNRIPKGKKFTIYTENICRPSKNILEGLYYDVTPKGRPPQQVTQNQQWGFQRIVPCIDDMTAKSTYKTTIIARKEYTHLLTNGDIIKDVKDIGKGRKKIIYKNMKTPMAPYLFFLGAGTYDSYVREFEYPDGYKFKLELLLFPGSDPIAAKKSLDILNDCIMWIHLFTGRDKYKDIDRKRKIINLTRKRDDLKNNPQKNKAKLTRIRNQLKKLIKNLTLGYKYTGTIYREIAIQNSDFGGMENVGNTVIAGNRIMPFKDIIDPIFEYMIRVKVHEFYHNINGSEVTGWSPFDIWLNEAVTVHIEREYHSHLTGNDYARLKSVFNYLGQEGMLERDIGPTAMPIEPDGFNDPNELITSVTYFKAPEFIRMIELILGKETFAKALAHYHKKYKNSNAKRSDWINCMEEISGLRLKRMAYQWLKQKGYPIVTVTTEYKNGNYYINLKQRCQEKNQIWYFPFSVAIFDKNGRKIKSKLETITKQETNIIFKHVNKPAFVSLNRGYSFFGKIIYKQATREQLILQIKKDTDYVNKYMALYQLLDEEKLNLIKNPRSPVDEFIIELFYELLSDKALCNHIGGLMFGITETVDNTKFAYKYKELYEARRKIMKAIAEKYKDNLLNIYNKYKNKKFSGSYVKKEIQSIKARQVKNTCLGLLGTLDTPDIHRLIKRQLYNSKNASDRLTAFTIYLNSSARDKMTVFKKFEKEAIKNPVLLEIFLATVGGNDSDNYLELIKTVEKSNYFHIEQSNHHRAVYEHFALNKKKSLLTKEGLNFLKESLIKLSPVNEYSTFNILKVFDKIDYLDSRYQVPIIKALLDIYKTIDKDKLPSVYNTLRRLISGSRKSLKAYEKVNGKVKI